MYFQDREVWDTHAFNWMYYRVVTSTPICLLDVTGHFKAYRQAR
jgi:hypothetical protein